MNAVSSAAGPSQEKLWASKLKSALKVKVLQFQMLPGFASGSSALRMEASRLKGSVETLGCEERKS